MSSRLDVIAARERTSKEGDISTHWVRIGSAWPRERGGWSVELDALPLPDSEGRVRFLLAEPKQDGTEERQPAQAPAPAAVPRNGAERYQQQQRQAAGRSRF
jgi:hypothetical protein